MSESEHVWFDSYNNLLFNYMRSIGDEGIDLCEEQEPPKFRYITVRNFLLILSTLLSL